MARLEASKESMRNSSVVDSDGANLVYTVTLEPKQWATYCKRNAEGWYNRNGTYTLGQIENEITRLQSLLQSYTKAHGLIETSPLTFPTNGAETPATTQDKANTEVATALEELYKAQAKVTGDRIKKVPSPTDIKKDVEDVHGKEKTLKDKKDTLDKVNEEWMKCTMQPLLPVSSQNSLA